MARVIVKTVFITSLLIAFVQISYSQTCANYTFSQDKLFDSCRDLPVLGAHLHWNYIRSTRTIQIAYRAAQSPSGWVAWAINLTGTTMVGSQAIVAFRNSNGTMAAYTTELESYNPSMEPESLSFKVSNVSAEYSNNEMTIFAIVGPLDNGTASVNHVWQAGDSVSNSVPQMHATSGDNIRSFGKIDFLSN